MVMTWDFYFDSFYPDYYVSEESIAFQLNAEYLPGTFMS